MEHGAEAFRRKGEMGKKRSRKGESRPVTEETRIRISKILQWFRTSNDEGTGILPFVSDSGSWGSALSCIPMVK